MKFKSYEKFVSYLKSLNNDSERMNAIMAYLLESASYDYTVLAWCKIAKNEELFEKVRAIDEKFDCKNPIERAQAIRYAKIELGLSPDVIEFIISNYGKEFVAPAKPERIIFGKVVLAEPEHKSTRNFVSALQLLGALPPIYQNGLIIKGVCKDFEEFIAKVCKDVGIKSKTISGQTSVGHQWNETLVNGQELVFDITYAMFARDGYADWGKKSKPRDWLGVLYSNILEMQPYRKKEDVVIRK